MCSAIRYIFTDMEIEVSNSTHLKLKSLLKIDTKEKYPRIEVKNIMWECGGTRGDLLSLRWQQSYLGEGTGSK